MGAGSWVSNSLSFQSQSLAVSVKISLSDRSNARYRHLRYFSQDKPAFLFLRSVFVEHRQTGSKLWTELPIIYRIEPTNGIPNMTQHRNCRRDRCTGRFGVNGHARPESQAQKDILLEENNLIQHWDSLLQSTFLLSQYLQTCISFSKYAQFFVFVNSRLRR